MWLCCKPAVVPVDRTVCTWMLEGGEYFFECGVCIKENCCYAGRHALAPGAAGSRRAWPGSWRRWRASAGTCRPRLAAALTMLVDTHSHRQENEQR